MRSETHSCL